MVSLKLRSEADAEISRSPPLQATLRILQDCLFFDYCKCWTLGWTSNLYLIFMNIWWWITFRSILSRDCASSEVCWSVTNVFTKLCFFMYTTTNFTGVQLLMMWQWHKIYDSFHLKHQGLVLTCYSSYKFSKFLWPNCLLKSLVSHTGHTYSDFIEGLHMRHKNLKLVYPQTQEHQASEQWILSWKTFFSVIFPTSFIQDIHTQLHLHYERENKALSTETFLFQQVLDLPPSPLLVTSTDIVAGRLAGTGNDVNSWYGTKCPND